MEKRLISAIIISLILIYFYNIKYLQPRMESAQKARQFQEQPKEKNQFNQTTSNKQISAESENVLIPQHEVTEKTDVTDKTIPQFNVKEETSVISNELVEIYLSNKGASIKGIRLKKFTVIGSEKILELTNSESDIFNENILLTDIDMQSELSTAYFQIIETKSNSIIYEYRVSGFMPDRSSGKVIKSNLPEGLIVRKEFILDPEKYTAEMILSFTDPKKSLEKFSEIRIEGNNKVYSGGLDIKFRNGLFVENEQKNMFYYFAANSMNTVEPGKGEVIYEPAVANSKQIKKEIIDKFNETSWFGLSTNYFEFIILLPENIQSNVAEIFSTENNISFRYMSSPLKFDKTGTVSYSFKIYAGPKDYYILKKTFDGVSLEQTINYGWFEILSLILLKVLNFFNKIIPNYGVSIIILTILINILIYPLKKKSLSAMEDMKVLQPKLQELKEKYKDDKARIQQETMKLYKENGVNPLGGCFPMLLQIPIFIGLFRMLQSSIELRGAEFIYIKDLSAADPYYILPIIMGITMFIQQKMTPAPPEQQKTMMFLPIIFTFLFKSMPAGLILYWTAFNIISILQQIYQQKTSKKSKKGVKK